MKRQALLVASAIVVGVAAFVVYRVRVNNATALSPRDKEIQASLGYESESDFRSMIGLMNGKIQSMDAAEKARVHAALSDPKKKVFATLVLGSIVEPSLMREFSGDVQQLANDSKYKSSAATVLGIWARTAGGREVVADMARSLNPGVAEIAKTSLGGMQNGATKGS